MGGMPFRDRVDAGRRLADSLRADPTVGADTGAVIVLGLPRGGVPVAFEIAQQLGAPLDVILVRKLGVPAQPELAMGAIGEDGVQVVNAAVLRSARISDEVLAAVVDRERAELERRAARIRAVRPRESLRARTAVIVDDGIATGATMRAACEVARAAGAARVVVAAPVAPPNTVAELRDVSDDVIVTEMPSRFFAIGEFYRDFSATTEDEVVQLLQR
jgi:putative phosphoribosyl transferase